MKISSYNEDYMSPHTCNSLKGICAVLILLSHLRGYIEFPNVGLNTDYNYVIDRIGQLMVAPYFFYSGFGILESYKRKPNYMMGFPKKRILKTLIHFDIAVLLFVVLGLCIGDIRPWINYLTCWIGATSVGNSNWFIFDILVLYVITYIAFKITKKSNYFALCVVVTILTIVFWIPLRIFSAGFWWYDTLMTFPAGMWFSCYYNRISGLLKRKSTSIAIIVITGLIYIIQYHYFWVDIYGITSCLFVFLIAMISSKVRIDNGALQWLGINAFAIYILQRFPMNLLRYFHVNDNYIIFTCVTIPMVLVIAYFYTRSLAKLDRHFFA